MVATDDLGLDLLQDAVMAWIDATVGLEAWLLAQRTHVAVMATLVARRVPAAGARAQADRCREVVLLLAAGTSVETVGGELGVSGRTVGRDKLLIAGALASYEAE